MDAGPRASFFKKKNFFFHVAPHSRHLQKKFFLILHVEKMHEHPDEK
jgi:hypothetical protein